MPIYEFLCPSCGHHFEKLVKLTEVPACPSCAFASPERQLSLSAGISTGKTRNKALTVARQRAKSVETAQAQAQAEYARNHPPEHHRVE